MTRGYTLVELVIVIGVFVMMLSALVVLYLRFGTTFAQQSASIEVSHSASSILNAFGQLSTQASGIPASYTINGTTYTTGSTTLVVQLPSISASGNVISGSYDYGVLTWSGTACDEVVSPSASSARTPVSKRLSTVVQNLTFTYNAADVTQATRVNADLTTGTTVRGQAFTTHLTAVGYPRNK